jgi:hypothetical protein
VRERERAPRWQTRDRCRPENVIRTITDEQASGYCVDWRYVTRDRRWVMVRDTHRTIQRGGWVFMPLSSFEPDREKWPAYGEILGILPEGRDLLSGDPVEVVLVVAENERVTGRARERVVAPVRHQDARARSRLGSPRRHGH